MQHSYPEPALINCRKAVELLFAKSVPDEDSMFGKKQKPVQVEYSHGLKVGKQWHARKESNLQPSG